jgi:hypothetical protein
VGGKARAGVGGKEEARAGEERSRARGAQRKWRALLVVEGNGCWGRGWREGGELGEASGTCNRRSTLLVGKSTAEHTKQLAGFRYINWIQKSVDPDSGCAGG